MGDLYCEGFDASMSNVHGGEYEEMLCGIPTRFGEVSAQHERGGKYATLTCGRLWESPAAGELTKAVSEVLSRFSAEAGAAGQRILVCALGNDKVIADSLGSAAVDKVIAGRIGARQVFSIKAGTTAATGVSSSEVAAIFAAATAADLVICIDSLAALTPMKLGSIIQISDCGITPGSGVSAHSRAINRKTLGVPVISIGIPTVISGQNGMLYTSAMADELIRRGGAVIAGGINVFAAKG